MNANVGGIDRVARIVAGVVLIALAGRGTGGGDACHAVRKDLPMKKVAGLDAGRLLGRPERG